MARFVQPSRYLAAVLSAVALLGCGCAREETATAPSAGAQTTRIRFQCDWYPQAEHGGFYQALAKGYYAEAGLEVELLPGGPGAKTATRVAAGTADLGMHRSDDILVHAGEGLPFVIVASFMQHDPQALLVHESSSVRSFADLDGKSVMAIPGTNWIQFLQKRYGIEFSLVPMNWGLARFMADPEFIQQCFVTSEPFFVHENGGRARTLLIADSGFDPYRIIFTTHRFLRENPEAVRKFIAASLRGWDDFMTGDPEPAKALIAARHPQMTAALMDFAIEEMRQRQLVHGRPEAGERLGALSLPRLREQQQTLHELGILKEKLALDRWVTLELLPAEIKAASQR